MRPATAVTVFHRTEDAAGFAMWAGELLASAESAPGHVSGCVSDLVDPRTDWAVAVTFAGEDQMHAWLDSAPRRELLRDGQDRGCCYSSGDLVLTEAGPTSAGVGVFRHAVSTGKQDDFREMQVRLSTAASTFPGYEGTVLIPADRDGEWLSIVRFRTGPHLSNWMRSAERTAALSGCAQRSARTSRRSPTPRRSAPPCGSRMAAH